MLSRSVWTVRSRRSSASFSSSSLILLSFTVFMTYDKDNRLVFREVKKSYTDFEFRALTRELLLP